MLKRARSSVISIIKKEKIFINPSYLERPTIIKKNRENYMTDQMRDKTIE
jgi:hypothetical protein